MDQTGAERLELRKPSYSKYPYKELPQDGNSIRVLKLHGAGDHNAEVECELLTMNYRRFEQRHHPFEALSWCWGQEPRSERIIIRTPGSRRVRWSQEVSPDLLAALKVLRRLDVDRCLWIDQICIDQSNPQERNHQVGMMAEIYSRATKVCVWLGEADTSSRTAINFIKEDILKLRDFDELCEGEHALARWAALLDLIHRPWFCRRWVVQEVALAQRAVVYCGTDKLSWEELASAIELFAETETSTRRLSELARQDPRFHRVPEWFEFAPALQASVLVNATNKLFRGRKAYDLGDIDDDSDHDMNSDYGDTLKLSPTGKRILRSPSPLSANAAEHSLRQPLLNLEYLISSLSMFQVANPHDAVYALLSIAKDTTPVANDVDQQGHLLAHTALEGFTHKRRFLVDYQKPFADVCKELVSFCVRSCEDKCRALDIICRPWAPDLTKVTSSGDIQTARKRRRADSFISINSRSIDSKRLRIHAPDMSAIALELSRAGSLQNSRHDERKSIPSWVGSIASAAFVTNFVPDMHTLKMNRRNADSLVGIPPSDQTIGRNYNASKPRGVDLASLKFVRRPGRSRWTMFVKGFVIDIVGELQPSSQGGAIHPRWPMAANWTSVHEEPPPNDFWRTLVADRGPDGRNPPAYYARACKDVFARVGVEGGLVSTSELLSQERNSFITRFCRRVQAVIWSRHLIVTNTGKLGLVSEGVAPKDQICILHGCSVPVILRCHKKTKSLILEEMRIELADKTEQMALTFRQLADARRQQRKTRDIDRLIHYFWDAAMQSRWARDSRGRQEWLSRYQTAIFRPETDNSNYVEVTMEGESQLHTITTNDHESVQDVLERKAYQIWKHQQRCQQLFSTNFKREDRRIFQIQLRWGRFWKSKTDRSKGRKIKYPHRGHPVSSNSVFNKMRRTSNDYKKRFEDRYMAQYRMKRADDGHDWELIDAKDPCDGKEWFYYESLGECYLHGMMDGEATDFQVREQIPLQVFDLR